MAHESQEPVVRYALAFALSPVPLLLVDPSGHIRLVNDQLAETFGYGPDALLGQTVEVLLPPEARAHHPELRAAYRLSAVKRAMGQGRELAGVTRDGRRIPLELGLTPVPHEGEVWTVVTAVDTSARHRDEALAQAALQAAASAMVMVDASGIIVSLNEATLTLFGYDEEELVGHAVEVLLPVDVRAQHPAFRQSFMKSGRARAMGAGQPLYGRKKSGEEFQLEAALTPVELGDETLVLATLVDLSEQLAKERAMAAREAAEAQAERLAQLNDDLTHFAYAASHDLKAPLATIHGMLRLAQEDLDEGRLDVVRRDLGKLRDLARSSADKVEAVLQLARVGHDQLPSGDVHLTPLATQLWQELTLGQAAPPRFGLRNELGGSFTSVPAAIEVVLRKLLSNAVRYVDRNEKDPWVRLRAWRERGSTLIEVADNGVGMSDAQVKTAFQMFGRLSSRSGHGLGLAIVRRQVEGLGGTIRCESREGEGTRFEVRLPERP